MLPHHNTLSTATGRRLRIRADDLKAVMELLSPLVTSSVQHHLLGTNRNKIAPANPGTEVETGNRRSAKAIQGAQKCSWDDIGQKGKLLCSGCQTTCFAVCMLHQQHSSPTQAAQKHLNFLFPNLHRFFFSLTHFVSH